MKQDSKIGKVIALLQRQEGATLDEMVAATCWLPHTTRAALTGLKKKGHAIERSKRGETSCYHMKVGAWAGTLSNSDWQSLSSWLPLS